MGSGGFNGRRGREICTIEVAWDTERCTGPLQRRSCTLENVEESGSTLAGLHGKRRDAYWHGHAFIAEFDAISTHADPVTCE